MSKQIQAEPAPEFTRADFAICDDDNESFCFHVFNNLEDTGHLGHKVRNPTEEEFPEFVKGDQETLTRCATESCDEFGFIVNLPEDAERHKGHELVEERIHAGDELVETQHSPICYSCHLPISRIVKKDASAFVYEFHSRRNTFDQSANNDLLDVSFHCGNILENKQGLSTGLCDAVIEDWVRKLVSPGPERELIIIQKLTPYVGKDSWLDCGGDHLKEDAAVPEDVFDTLSGKKIMYSGIHVKGDRASSDNGYGSKKEIEKQARILYPGVPVVYSE